MKHCRLRPPLYLALMEQAETKIRSVSGTAKIDATTLAAYDIIEKRDQDRNLKTARLKALRLERDEQAAVIRATALPKIRAVKKRIASAAE